MKYMKHVTTEGMKTSGMWGGGGGDEDKVTLHINAICISCCPTVHRFCLFEPGLALF